MERARPKGFLLRRGGFTLIELLTVIAIVSLIAGIGIGVYATARRGLAFEAAVGQVSAILREARNFSIESGTPSRVLVEPTERRLSASGFDLIGAWHFEGAGEGPPTGQPIPDGTKTSGAFNIAATVKGGALRVPGKLGDGIEFRGAGGHVDCDRLPRWSPRPGVAVEAWIFWTGSPAAGRGESFHRIIGVEGSYVLGLTGALAIEGRIGSYAVRTRPGRICAYRWTKVEMIFEREGIRLFSDGIEQEVRRVGERPGTGRGWHKGGQSYRPAGSKGAEDRTPDVPEFIPASTQPLLVSSPTETFQGIIDEVKVKAGVEPEAVTLPVEVTVIGWRREIVFDRRGYLDPTLHMKPPVIYLAGVRPDEPEEDVAPPPSDTDEKSPSPDPEARSEGKAPAPPVAAPDSSKGKEGSPDFSLSYGEWAATLREWPKETEDEAVQRIIRAHGPTRVRAVKVEMTGTVTIAADTTGAAR